MSWRVFYRPAATKRWVPTFAAPVVVADPSVNYARPYQSAAGIDVAIGAASNHAREYQSAAGIDVVLAAASNRARVRQSAAALDVVLGSALNHARVRQSADGVAFALVVADPSASYARPRQTSAAFVRALAAASNRARVYQSTAALDIALGASAGRLRVRQDVAGIDIATGQVLNYVRVRQLADGAPVVAPIVTSDPSIGRLRAYQTGDGASFTPVAPTEFGRPLGDLIIPRTPAHRDLFERRGLEFAFDWGTQTLALGAVLGRSEFLFTPVLGRSEVRAMLEIRSAGVGLGWGIEPGETELRRWFPDEVTEILRWIMLTE